MIRIITGNVGSGKSLTAVARIIRSDKQIFSNMKISIKNNKRLKFEHIVKTDIIEDARGKAKEVKVVNWDFWKSTLKQHPSFSIYLDEMHNIFSSRLSNTRNNVTMSRWLAQIRKITGSNENTDLVAITQEITRVDVVIRELCHEVIYCTKLVMPDKTDTVIRVNGRLVTKKLPMTYIVQTYFTGASAVSRYGHYRNTNDRSLYNRKTYLYANPIFKFYDSYEIIEFGEGAYL